MVLKNYHWKKKLKRKTFPLVAQNFYPVRLGGVFSSRYLVVAKLGFGTIPYLALPIS